jgi:peptidoglycan-N-acetylglucosamine deacetylase
MMRFYKVPSIFRKILPSQIIWRIKTSEKKIYLTFDDGPNPDVTPQVLSLLDQYHAKATFFCLGENAEKHPSLMADIVNRGHSLGNHSFSHPDAWKTSPGSYIEDIEKADKIIGTSFFRPPYGHIPLRRFRKIASRYQIIMWSVMSYDFDPDITADKLLKVFAAQKVINGTIWVFHDKPGCAELIQKVLPQLLEKYSSEGYDFENLECGLKKKNGCFGEGKWN